MAGINQLKSKRARSPANEASERIRISSPLQRASKSSKLSTSGRCAWGSWISALPSSRRAMIKKRPSSAVAIAGSGVWLKRDNELRAALAFRPSFFAAISSSARPNWRPSSANSWVSCSGEAATLWKRASMTKQARPVSSPAPGSLNEGAFDIYCVHALTTTERRYQDGRTL